MTLFVQDWGSLIGLRIAAEQDERIARIVVANGFLPTAQQRTPLAFYTWRAFARYTPILPAGRLVAIATVRTVPAEVRAGYDAPFPDKTYQAGARAFPQLMPTSPDDPAVPANRTAWDALGRWEKPFLAFFGAADPILGRADRPLIEHIPGAAGPPHDRIRGGHFIQEDCGPELAARILSWEQARRWPVIRRGPWWAATGTLVAPVEAAEIALTLGRCRAATGPRERSSHRSAITSAALRRC